MDEYRKLMYEDKTSLNDFGIYDEESLNSLIYDEWLLRRTEINSFEGNQLISYLKVFNDTYYICTIALLLPTNSQMTLAKLLNTVDTPSIVFPLVHFYLSRLTSISREVKRFITELEKSFIIYINWSQNEKELQDVVCEYEETICPDLFAQRKLTAEVLASVNWEYITNKFKKERIKEVVRNYARTPDDWRMMVDAIKAAAIKYDYDDGFEEIEQEAYDPEYGPYTQTIKVPREPYDCEGNYNLEPLKLAGVYDFCDELKEKYEELSLKRQAPRMEPMPRTAHRKEQEGKLLFRENLDLAEIKDTLMSLKGELVGKDRIGERIFFKIAHDVFLDLKWLNATKQTHFIKWAQEKNIMGATTENFKGVKYDKSDGTFDTILSSFSERMQNQRYLDKDKFYELNPQGDRKRKYNNG